MSKIFVWMPGKEWYWSLTLPFLCIRLSQGIDFKWFTISLGPQGWGKKSWWIRTLQWRVLPAKPKIEPLELRLEDSNRMTESFR